MQRLSVCILFSQGDFSEPIDMIRDNRCTSVRHVIAIQSDVNVCMLEITAERQRPQAAINASLLKITQLVQIVLL